MKNYLKQHRETIFPLGVASAAMGLILAAAALLNEISPAAVL